MIIIGGVLQENPFFVPPDEFLRSRLHRVQAGIIDLIPKCDCAIIGETIVCHYGYSDKGKTGRDCR
jgi:hypothetical protein